MKRIRPGSILLGAVFAALAGAPLARAQGTVEAGEFRFEIPDGWKRAESNGMTLLMPGDLPRGRVTYIAIAPGKDLTGPFRTWFDKEWALWQREYRLLDGGKINVQHAANGYDAIWTDAHIADKTGKRLYILVFTAASGKRVGEFFLMSDEDLSEGRLSAVRSLIRSLQMQDVMAAETPPAALSSPRPSGSGGLDGLYRTARLNVVDSYDAVLDRMSKGPGFEHILFFPDGRFYSSFPEAGAQNFNYDAYCRRGPQFCGAYTLNGNSGSITYGSSYTQPVERIPDGSLLIGGKRYVRLDPCDGLTLEGTFRRKDFRAEYSPQEGITLTRDGRFFDEGVASAATVLWWNERDGFVFDDGKGGRGTYRIIRYSLELTYADGRFKRITFNLEPGASRANVTSFVLNSWTFIRVQ